MQPNNEFHSLLRDLIANAQEIIVLWQIAVLLASLGLAWLLQRQLGKRMASRVSAGPYAGCTEYQCSQHEPAHVSAFCAGAGRCRQMGA